MNSHRRMEVDFVEMRLSEETRDQIPLELIEACEAHWKGDYQKSLEAYSRLDEDKLEFFLRELARADRLMLQSKMGLAQDLRKVEDFRSPTACSFFHYARYTWAFWVDHKIAWNSLWSLLFLSFRSKIRGQFWMALFLVGHMLAIGGYSRSGSRIAQLAHAMATRAEQRKRGYSRLASNIIFAAYPYTLVVSGRLDERFSEIASLAETYLSPEPYYVALFQISSLYGYAYTADVVKAEIYAERLHRIHEKNQLIRYRPLSRMMPLLPISLRGFSRLIKDRFEVIVASHDADESDPLVNSQFFRAAAIISLCLRQNERARFFIERASKERAKTHSFLIWKKFDEQVRRYAESKEFFDPETANFVIGNRFQKTPPQVGELYIEALHSLVDAISITETELEEKLAELICEHLNIHDYAILEEIPNQIDGCLRIKLSSSFLELRSVPTSRQPTVRALLGFIAPIILDIFHMYHSLQKSRLFEREASLGKLAAQVAHDIRSPLAAIDMTVHSDLEIPQESSLILKQATSRLKDIANNLLNERRLLKKQDSGVPIRTATVELVSHYLEQILAEKRTQYRDRPGLQIALKMTTPSRLRFARMEPQSFMRMLSCFIDNSVEASGSTPLIDVSLKENDEELILEVKDQGSGFPKEILQDLGKKEISFGKAHGNGLGLFESVRSLASWGGRAEFSNTEQGAQVRLILKKEPPPSWCVDELVAPPSGRVVVIDNDPSILGLWRSRLGGRVLVAQNAQALRQLLPSLRVEETSFLVDYELDRDLTGIDLIREFKLFQAFQCHLSTSHFESSVVRQQCKDLGIRVLPKPLAGFVPVETGVESV